MSDLFSILHVAQLGLSSDWRDYMPLSVLIICIVVAVFLAMIFRKRRRPHVFSGKPQISHQPLVGRPAPPKPASSRMEPVNMLKDSQSGARAPQEAPYGLCAKCGRPFRTRKISKTAVCVIDDSRRVEQSVVVTQIICEHCGLTANDDLYGDFAKANRKLAQIAPDKREFTKHSQIVDDIIVKTRNLNENADVDIQADFDSVQQAFDAVKILTLTEAELKTALAVAVEGNIKEGFDKIKVDVEGRKYIQVNALGKAWRPYRIWKSTKGALCIYGHVSLYRFTGNA